MYDMLNIPEHTGCRNCGDCCTLVPATPAEIDEIRRYISEKGITPLRKRGSMACPFHDDGQKRCVIYPVRPLICRLMGVAKGLNCRCGNSANIDGRKFTPADIDINKMQLLNAIDWTGGETHETD